MARFIPLFFVFFAIFPAFAADHLGGKMTGNSCYNPSTGRYRSMVKCVEQRREARNDLFRARVIGSAFYRDPTGANGVLTDVAFAIELDDPSNFYMPEAEVPVLARVQLCRNEWGCDPELRSMTATLKRVPNQRRLKGSLNLQFTQDFSETTETWVTDLEILFPGSWQAMKLSFE